MSDNQRFKVKSDDEPQTEFDRVRKEVIKLWNSLKPERDDSRKQKRNLREERNKRDRENEKIVAAYRKVDQLLDLLTEIIPMEEKLCLWRARYDWGEALQREYLRETGIRSMFLNIIELGEQIPESCLLDPARLHAAAYNTYGNTALRQFRKLSSQPVVNSRADELRKMKGELMKWRTVMQNTDRYSIEELETLENTISGTILSLKADYERYRFMAEAEHWIQKLGELYAAMSGIFDSPLFEALERFPEASGELRAVCGGEEARADAAVLEYWETIKKLCQGSEEHMGLCELTETWTDESLDRRNTKNPG